MEEKISVIVPIFNTEKYIEKCVKSIINQTYKNLDIILVDDGSIDNSYHICLQLAKQDKRIKLIRQENRGVLSAKMHGLEHTDAPYVMFVDSDDWIDEKTCEVYSKAMTENEVDVVSAGIIRAFPDDTFKFSYNTIKAGKYSNEAYRKEIIPYMLCCGYFFQCGIDPSMATKLFRRDILLPLIESAAKNNFYYGEDVSVVYPYLLKVSSIYIIDQCLYYHRQYENHIAFYTNDKNYHSKLDLLYEYLRDIFESNEHSLALMRQLDWYYKYSKYLAIPGEYKALIDDIRNIGTMKWLFPFKSIKKDSKIVLYGAGEVGKCFYRQLENSDFCVLSAWMDKNCTLQAKDGFPILPPAYMSEVDCYVIAIANENLALNIRRELIMLGVEEEKIVWNDYLLRLW